MARNWGLHQTEDNNTRSPHILAKGVVVAAYLCIVVAASWLLVSLFL